MLIECKDLIKIYPSPVEGLMFPALRGLDLSIEKGELISIIGPSGAGKSTLLRLISGFDLPSSGEIWFDGRLLNQFSEDELYNHRKNVGIMYQSPRENLIWGLSVFDNVLFPMRYSGKYGEKQRQKALELLERVGLSEKSNRKPAQLSGGEQQRVAIATALANDPIILLADEPTGELDSTTTGIIIDYFKELKVETGLTICVVTHDRRFSKLTDKTFKIQDGRLTTLQVGFMREETFEQTEETAIIDSQGNVRLPTEVLELFKGMSSVKIVVKGNKIELIPVDTSRTQKSEEN
ncbi:MAG: ABC transporter ATP-binding protein [Candidatus Hodarchaeota archaeon]